MGPAGANGADAPHVQFQYSADGMAWHGAYAAGDQYFETSVDGGVTWGSAVFFKGATGATGPQGPAGIAGNVSAAYPIGSIYISSSATNPGTSLGFGTWAQVAQSRFIIGQDSTSAVFNVAGNTGGNFTQYINTTVGS